MVRLTSGRNYQLLPEVRRPITILLEITLTQHKLNSGLAGSEKSRSVGYILCEEFLDQLGHNIASFQGTLGKSLV